MIQIYHIYRITNEKKQHFIISLQSRIVIRNRKIRLFCIHRPAIHYIFCCAIASQKDAVSIRVKSQHYGILGSIKIQLKLPQITLQNKLKPFAITITQRSNNQTDDFISLASNLF